MNNKILKATHGSSKTPLKLGKFEIPCYVLEDGRRVLSGRGMQNALGYSSKSSGSAIQNLIKDKNIKTYISPDIFEKLNSRIAFECFEVLNFIFF